MGMQADIAQALLETIVTCVDDCTMYQRQLWTLGDPAIECSTLGIGINSFPVAAQVSECAIHELRLNIVVAQCCFPTGNSDGTPPSVEDLMSASRCVLDDVERIVCCLRAMTIDIPGAIKQCKPKLLTPQYSRSGGCAVAKIAVTLNGVPQT